MTLRNSGYRLLNIKFSKLANQDLSSIHNYIKHDQPQAAQAIIHRIIEAVEILVKFPSLGRPGRVSHTRELVLSNTPFLIIYQVRQNSLYIVRILHAAQKWGK